MSVTNKQDVNRYPGGPSVPVLFALKNVQPAIFANAVSKQKTDSISKDSASASVSREPASHPSASVTPNQPRNSLPEPTQFSESNVTAASNSPKRVRNRIYNGSIAVLVLVLLALVVRNAQSARNVTPERIASTVAASTVAASTVAASTVAASTVANAYPARHAVAGQQDGFIELAPNGIRTAELPILSVGSPVSALSSSGIADSTSSSIHQGLTVGTNPTPLLLEKPQSPSSTSPGSLAAPSTSIPGLLASSQPNTPDRSGKDSPVPNAISGADPMSIRIQQTAPSTPSPLESNVGSRSPATTNTTTATNPHQVLETNYKDPELSALLRAHEAIYGTGRAATTVSSARASLPYVPTASNGMGLIAGQQPYIPMSANSAPISNPVPNSAPYQSIQPQQNQPIQNQPQQYQPQQKQPIQQQQTGQQPQTLPSNVAGSQLLVGKSYPAQAQENTSSAIPAYEQNAWANRSIGNPINPSDTTAGSLTGSRSQQAGNAGNRYQLIQQPTTPSYQPIAPSSNSIGYPPSN